MIRSSAIAVLIAVLFTSADLRADENKWTFEDDKVGAVTDSWEATKTGEGPGSLWKIVADDSAPSGSHAIGQLSLEGPKPLFNLCVVRKESYRDVDLSVNIKAVCGTIDQGGGPVWRYQDANNYYIARANPLENNFRVYKVVDG